jgi:hypothetical protein
VSEYTGKWTCEKCNHTSDNEHDPCNCDEDCCEHVETIAAVRAALAESQRISALRGEEVAKWAHESGTVKGERDKLRGLLDEAITLARDAIDSTSEAGQRLAAIAKEGKL